MCLFSFILRWKPVFDTSVISSNSLSFCLFILWKHIAFPWLSMTFTRIPWFSRYANWNHKFHDFPGFPWPIQTLFWLTGSTMCKQLTLTTQTPVNMGWSCMIRTLGQCFISAFQRQTVGSTASSGECLCLASWLLRG